jgi:hypothetical protein
VFLKNTRSLDYAAASDVRCKLPLPRSAPPSCDPDAGEPIEEGPVTCIAAVSPLGELLRTRREGLPFLCRETQEQGLHLLISFHVAAGFPRLTTDLR